MRLFQSLRSGSKVYLDGAKESVGTEGLVCRRAGDDPRAPLVGGLGCIENEPVQPGTGDADRKRVGTATQIGGDVGLIGRCPKGIDHLTVQADDGNVLHFAKSEQAGTASPAAGKVRTIALVCVIAAIAVVAALLASRFLAAEDSAGTEATASSAESSRDTTTVTAPQGEKDTQTAADILSVGESHWSTSSGSVYAEYSLTNNSNRTVAYPSVTITGYADDGSVLFSDEQVLSVLAPGETAYQSTALDGSTAPARVEFTPVKPSEDLLSDDAAPSLSTANESARSNGYGGITVSGTVTLEKDGTTMALGNNYGVCLTAILRDASGNIVGGGVNFLSSHPAEGSSMPFEVSIFERVDYATCEVHAIAW